LIYVYYDGNNEKIIHYINQKENVIYKKYKNFDLDFDVNYGVVKSDKTYFKYFLWTDEFRDFDKILFLDVYILVLGSLDELFQKNEFFIVSDHSINYRTTIFPYGFKDDEKLIKLLSEDGFVYPIGQDSMANVGVLLVSNKYRTKSHLDKLVYFTRRYNKYLQFGEQSAISLWCTHNNIKYSYDYRYNLQILHFYTNLANDPEIIDNARILHFSYYKPDYLDTLIQAQDLIKIAYNKYQQYNIDDIR
jgi:lipopolysaccharide biosynthesis glycosyltransferase